MIERAINWQTALTYSDIAARTRWAPDPIEPVHHPRGALLTMTARLKIRDIRDWITQSVGQEYALTAIFVEQTGKPQLEMQLPHLLRFWFTDAETALLFKLRWI